MGLAVSPQLVVWLEASQRWSLQVVGWGQVLVQMSQYGSHQECLCGWKFRIMSASSVLCPQGEPQPPFAPPGDSPRPAGRCSPGSYQITAFALGPSAHEILCVLKVRSVFPPVFWGLSFWCQIPGLGSLTWGSGLSLLWENLCCVIILQFEDCPAKWYGIWLYLPLQVCSQQLILTVVHSLCL